MYSKDSLDLLRQRVDLVELISSHVELKRSGAVHKGRCPFHDEKTPSFMVHKGDSHYHCFGCGAHGDGIQFLMAHLKMSFMEAVESLAERFQVPLEKVADHGKKGINKTELKQGLECASRFFECMLLHTKEGQKALHYLHQRDIDLEFIRTFRIGYAPQTPGMLRKVLLERSISDGVLTETALMTSSMRDFFVDRITFPIHDAAGAVIGFSARKFKEETFGGKYVNTPETTLFKKSRTLFGLNYSRKRIIKERKALIVEGQIDALRLIHAGFDYTVAGQGTAFGEGHVKELLALGINQAILALDGDLAGQEAAVKIGDLFQREGAEVRVVNMPVGMDPDGYIRREGAAAFQKLIDESRDYLTFLVHYEGKKVSLDSPAAKNGFLLRLAQQIREWEQPVLVHESLRKLAALTQTPEAMIGVGQTFIPNLYVKHYGAAGQQQIDPDRIMEADLLCWLLLTSQSLPQLKELTKRALKPDDLRVPVCKKLYEMYLQQENLDLASLLYQVEDEESQRLLNEFMQKKLNIDKADSSVKEVIQKILDRNWIAQREEVKMKIQSGACSDEEVWELAKQFDQLKNSRPSLT